MKWWTGLAPVVTQLETESGVHDIVWADGLLSSPQHGDAESERTMVALGATRCSCLDVFEGWTDHHHDPAVLTIGPRTPADPVGLEMAAFAGLKGRVDIWRRNVANVVAQAQQLANVSPRTLERLARPADDRARRRLAFLRLWTLPPAFHHRLQATVIEHLIGSWPDSEPALAVALLSRVRAADRTVYDVHALDPSAPSAAAPDAADDEGGAVIGLPVTWLLEVWARGAATIDGHLVLNVSDVTPDGRECTAEIRGIGKARVEYLVDQWENPWHITTSRS